MMPIRFLVVISPDPDLHSRVMARATVDAMLGVRHTVDQVSIAADAPASVIPVSNTGVVIGHLFQRNPVERGVTKLHSQQQDDIARRGISELLSSYWGGYFAIAHHPNGEIEVLRDPSGALPCYFVQGEDCIVLASDVETLFKAGALRPSLDWEFLAQHLYFTDLRTPRTGLAGVSELLAGQVMRISTGGVEIQPAWTPWDYAATAKPDVSPEDLRDIVLGCVRAWASRFKRVSLGVSGGLDSSIVAAALKGHSDAIYFTFATEELDGDERRYARTLTDHLGVELRERFHRLDQVDVTQTVSAHLPRPVGFAFGQSLYAYLLELASRDNVEAWFSGIGGDNVFCYMSSATPALDRFLAQGPLPAFSTLLDVCDLTGATIWDATKNAYAKSRRGLKQPAYVGNASMLAHRRYDTELPTLHPWLAAPAGTLPGKAVHAAMLARIQSTIDGVSRFEKAARMTPLLSQPIVETCLRVPTWRWCEGGRNRALARDAFSSLLPARLINRRSKGGPGAFAYTVLSHNRGRLRDHLLGGILAAKELLDTVAIEAALAGDTALAPFDMTRLSSLAEAEAWARHWIGLEGGAAKRLAFQGEGSAAGVIKAAWRN